MLKKNWEELLKKDVKKSIAFEKLEVQRDINRIKKAKALDKKTLNNWIKQSNISIDKKLYLKMWEDISIQTVNTYLPIVISVLAKADGFDKINKVLKNTLKLEEAEINFDEILDKLFHIEIMNAMLRNMKVGYLNKRLIMRRYIAREFPLRDNIIKNKNDDLNKVLNQVKMAIAQTVDKN